MFLYNYRIDRNAPHEEPFFSLRDCVMDVYMNPLYSPSSHIYIGTHNQSGIGSTVIFESNRTDSVNIYRGDEIIYYTHIFSLLYLWFRDRYTSQIFQQDYHLETIAGIGFSTVNLYFVSKNKLILYQNALITR